MNLSKKIVNLGKKFLIMMLNWESLGNSRFKIKIVIQIQILIIIFLLDIQESDKESLIWNLKFLLALSKLTVAKDRFHNNKKTKKMLSNIYRKKIKRFQIDIKQLMIFKIRRKKYKFNKKIILLYKKMT